MKAPFEKFEVVSQEENGSFYGSRSQFIETAIRNKLARTANTQEGK